MAENRRLNYFSEANVLERFKKPPSYFEKISTVAFKPVSWLSNYICIASPSVPTINVVSIKICLCPKIS